MNKRMNWEKESKFQQICFFFIFINSIMENKYQSQHQSMEKTKKKVKIVTQQSNATGRLICKQSAKGLRSSTTAVIRNNDSNKNKFIKCIFIDKYNILSSQNNLDVNKYLTMKVMSQERKKNFKVFHAQRNLNKYNTKILEKYKNLNKNSEPINQMPYKQQQKPYELYIQIKHVFKHLQILKNYGFSEKKITKWMSSYLSKKTRMIQDLFIKSYLNKKSLNNSIIFERCTTLENIIHKMEKLVEKLHQSEILFLINEIRCFKSYIQDIVIKMTQANLDEIFNIGDINPILKFNRENNFTVSPEIAHFVKDLKTIQDRYGEMSTISKRNRAMFKQVSDAEQKFVDQFHKIHKDD